MIARTETIARTEIQHRREEGYILASVTVLIFVMSIVVVAYFNLASMQTRSVFVDAQSQQSFWLAEAGKERTLNWLNNQFTPPTHNTTVYSNVAGPAGGTYTVNVLVDTTQVYSAQKNFTIESVGNFGNSQRRVMQTVVMSSFALYAYFTDDEAPPDSLINWFNSTDVLQGRVHTNTTLHINGSPTFQGFVTSADSQMIGFPSYRVNGPAGWPVGANSPVFEQGFQLSLPTIPLPARTLDLKSQAQTGGLYLPNASLVQLGWQGQGAGVAAPGWLRYTDVSDSTFNNAVSLQISTLSNRVLYCDNPLSISGTLQGELTASSSSNITIVDDIFYAGADTSGAPQIGCTDLLGLVAGGNIYFDYHKVNNVWDHRTYNLHVDGVLMALNTSIAAISYKTPPTRGPLTIWGGLIQKYPGQVGRFKNGPHGPVLDSGYAKNYHYDTRMTAHTPPAFPLTGIYQNLIWQETNGGNNPS